MKSKTTSFQPKSGSVNAWHRSMPDLWQLFLDVVAVAVLVTEGYRIGQESSSGFASFALLAGGLAAVVVRRRLPALALAATALLTVFLPLQTGQHLPAWILLEVCLASFAMLKPRTYAVAATSAVGFVLVGESFLLLHLSVFDPLSWALVAWTAAAGGVGSAVRFQRQYVEALEEQASSLVRTREAAVARRIAEERMRIARELHDVMAHHIAAISVHAGSAEANTLKNPQTAMESLVRIRTASSEALRELQAILHVLRSGETGTEVDIPAAGASQLPQLLEAFRLLGLRVDYHEDGILPRNLPPALDLALYRITQEGLTNVHKHGSGTARLDLTTTSTGIHLRIRNNATAAPEATHTGRPFGQQGFGIVGMQERAISAGGRLSVASDGKHFTVEASFPLRAAR
jgi:signal transduction histidine kinase